MSSVSLEIYNSRLGHLADLNGGICFGETALLDNQPRNATVRATSAARLWQVPARSFVTFTVARSGSEREQRGAFQMDVEDDGFAVQIAR